jgi:curved DNA-binding protein CbpA
MERTEALKILEITSRATDLEIKKAYRRLSLLWHPDKYEQNPTKHPANSKEQAEAKMKEINQAYGILTEKEKKINNDSEISDDDIWLAKTKIEVALEILDLDYEDVFEGGDDDYLEILNKCRTKEELEDKVWGLLWRIQMLARAYENGHLEKKSTKKNLEREREEAEEERKFWEEQNKKVDELKKRWEELQAKEKKQKKDIGIIVVIVVITLLGWWGWRKIREVFFK